MGPTAPSTPPTTGVGTTPPSPTTGHKSGRHDALGVSPTTMAQPHPTSWGMRVRKRRADAPATTTAPPSPSPPSSGSPPRDTAPRSPHFGENAAASRTFQLRKDGLYLKQAGHHLRQGLRQGPGVSDRRGRRCPDEQTHATFKDANAAGVVELRRMRTSSWPPTTWTWAPTGATATSPPRAGALPLTATRTATTHPTSRRAAPTGPGGHLRPRRLRRQGHASTRARATTTSTTWRCR